MGAKLVSVVEVDDDELVSGVEEGSELNLMNLKPMAQSNSPSVIIGIAQRRIRRRPIRSIKMRATQLMPKFVRATESDVRVGLAKPNILNIVAEKYMSEFCFKLIGVRKRAGSTYESTQLLKSLQ